MHDGFSVVFPWPTRNISTPGTASHAAVAELSYVGRGVDVKIFLKTGPLFWGSYRFKGRILVRRSQEWPDVWVVFITSQLCCGSITCVFSICTSWALWSAFPTWKKEAYFSSPGGVYGPRWFARGIEAGQEFPEVLTFSCRRLTPIKVNLRTVNILDLEPVIWDWEETWWPGGGFVFFCLGSLSSLQKWFVKRD